MLLEYITNPIFYIFVHMENGVLSDAVIVFLEYMVYSSFSLTLELLGSRLFRIYEVCTTFDRNQSW